MQYEVEIKCLIPGKLEVDRLVDRMKNLDPSCKYLVRNELRNHYFDCDNTQYLQAVGTKFLRGPDLIRLNDVIDQSEVISMRTRCKNDQVLLIAKGVPAGGDAIHGSSRLELEVVVDVKIEELDQALVDSGLVVLAKWSGYKDVYKFLDITIEIQFSAGYGYMVELEKVVTSQAQATVAEARVRQVAKDLGLAEVDHDLIGRMYDYYNAHWSEYYDTDKTFSATVLKSLQ